MGRPRDPTTVFHRVITYVEKHGPLRTSEVQRAFPQVKVSSLLANAWSQRRLRRLARGLYAGPKDTPDV